MISKSEINLMEAQFFSIKQVAAIFGVHHCTVRRAVKAGYIVAFRIGDKKHSPYRISKASIESLHTDTMKELARRYKKIA